MSTSSPILTMKNLWSDFMGEREKIEHQLGIFPTEKTNEIIKNLRSKGYDVYYGVRSHMKVHENVEAVGKGYYKFFMQNYPGIYVREIYADDGKRYEFRTLRSNPSGWNMYSNGYEEGAQIKVKYNEGTSKYVVRLTRHQKCIVYDENDKEINIIADDTMGATVAFDGDAIIFLDQEVTSNITRKRVHMQKLTEEERKEHIESLKEEE